MKLGLNIEHGTGIKHSTVATPRVIKLVINKCIWNSYESDDMSEVERMKFARDDAEVWDRAEEMIAVFTMKGSAQFSKQHGLLKSTVSFSECCVVKTYEYAWFKIS